MSDEYYNAMDQEDADLGVAIQANQASAYWAPSAVNPAASSWDDVLKFGLARVIDAKVRPVTPENTIPYYQRKPYYSPITGAPVDTGNWWMWLLLAGVGVGIFVLAGKSGD